MHSEQILSLLMGRQWAIMPDTLNAFMQSAYLMADGETPEENAELQALLTTNSKPIAGTRSLRMKGDVAILPISGPIFRQSNFYSLFFGGASLDVLAPDFAAALKNPDISSIVLDIDSPGGEVSGINEFSNQIFAARGIKPIEAYVSAYGASAAYWIGANCDAVYCEATAMLGSIGIAMVASKGSAREYDIVSSQSPYKIPDPSKDADRKRLQTTVDALADVFIASVARGRGVTTKKVKSDYGKGDVLVGVNAVNAGLADGIDSLEGIIARLSGETAARSRSKTPTTQAAVKLDFSAHNTPNHPGRRNTMSLIEKLLGRKPTNAEAAQFALDAAATLTSEAEGQEQDVSLVSQAFTNANLRQVAPATALIPGVTALAASERVELDRLRTEASVNATRVTQALQASAKTTAVAFANGLLKDGKIASEQKDAFATAFEKLGMIAAVPGLADDALAVAWDTFDDKGNPVKGSSSLYDFFAAAVQNKPVAGWTEEIVPSNADALFNRTVTTEKPSNTEAKDPGEALADRMVQQVTGKAPEPAKA